MSLSVSHETACFLFLLDFFYVYGAQIEVKHQLVYRCWLMKVIMFLKNNLQQDNMSIKYPFEPKFYTVKLYICSYFLSQTYM